MSYKTLMAYSHYRISILTPNQMATLSYAELLTLHVVGFRFPFQVPSTGMGLGIGIGSELKSPSMNVNQPYNSHLFSYKLSRIKFS